MGRTHIAIAVAGLMALQTGSSNAQEAITVQIDIDPRTTDNVMTIGKTRVISVAIISTKDFDASKRVEDEDLHLGGVLVEKGGWGSGDHPKCNDSDINGDGIFDLVCKFDFRKLKLSAGQHKVMLTGKTMSDHIAFSGEDSIVVEE